MEAEDDERGVFRTQRSMENDEFVRCLGSPQAFYPLAFLKAEAHNKCLVSSGSQQRC